jgi:cysteine desulfurase
VSRFLFFDNASTTRCCRAAAELVQRFATEDFGNPSSSHALGQQAAKAIRESRLFFARVFNVNPEQIVFTGSGSESDNLAVYGIALEALARHRSRGGETKAPRVITSAIEHPAVKRTVLSLVSLGIDARLAPITPAGQIDPARFEELLTPETVLVSFQRVNNIMGALLPVEKLAELTKRKVPQAIFHTDAVQAFGRVDVPTSPSAVDLVSISAHKIEGPKGVGALVLLNKQLVKTGLRPVIWGGEQEGGLRSGTQNAGLIAGFHAAAEQTLASRAEYQAHVAALRSRLRERLEAAGCLSRPGEEDGSIRWNSPDDAVPYIVNLSVPGYPSGPLARLLEERHCLVSTGSACSSQKVEPDAVLSAMGLPAPVCSSAIRVSFSRHNTLEDVDALAHAFRESIELMSKLLDNRAGKADSVGGRGPGRA